MLTLKVHCVHVCAGSCSTGSAVTCDECLQLSSHCAWCTQEVSIARVCMYETTTCKQMNLLHLGM